MSDNYNNGPSLRALLAGSEPCTPSPRPVREPPGAPRAASSSSSGGHVAAPAPNRVLNHSIPMLNLDGPAGVHPARISVAGHDAAMQNLLERERRVTLREQRVERRELNLEPSAERSCNVEQFLEPETSHPNSYETSAAANGRQPSNWTGNVANVRPQLGPAFVPVSSRPGASVNASGGSSSSGSSSMAQAHAEPGPSVDPAHSAQYQHAGDALGIHYNHGQPAPGLPGLSWPPPAVSYTHAHNMQPAPARLLQGLSLSSAAAADAAAAAAVRAIIAATPRGSSVTPPLSPDNMSSTAPSHSSMVLRPMRNGHMALGTGQHQQSFNVMTVNHHANIDPVQTSTSIGLRGASTYSENSTSGLSPTAAEFVFSRNQGPAIINAMPNTWARSSRFARGQASLGVAHWRELVQKIITDNDQQASILLQQKLKNASIEEKHDMCQAILDDTINLARNRFGNFLVQRCMEYGNEAQITVLAFKLVGNVVELSQDIFACHVMQKALDVVPEHFKMAFVQEMLLDIRATIVQRYACHVWQKLFELRWESAPPQIMTTVNRQLRGRWAEVAMDETRSLVVQNIFENCVEADKRACIEEVMLYIGIISRGQYGNWCIQHICEHGADGDRVRALNHVIYHAGTYSMDQFASKVVEKCLKVAGPEFMDSYLSKISIRSERRVRSALIDIAADQYGNYLIQWILKNAAAEHREVVIRQVRQHMVSLRGSRYGARVATMCVPGSSAH